MIGMDITDNTVAFRLAALSASIAGKPAPSIGMHEAFYRRSMVTVWHGNQVLTNYLNVGGSAFKIKSPLSRPPWPTFRDFKPLIK
jgi:hypothetical protein